MIKPDDQQQQESTYELYKLYRSYIEHEDDLINQRISALLTVQSFLIGTYGFSYQKRFEIAVNLAKDNILADRRAQTETQAIPKTVNHAAIERSQHQFDIFLLSLAFIGAVTAWLASRSITHAHNAILSLYTKWRDLACLNRHSNHLPVIIGGGDEKAAGSGLNFSRTLPPILLILWVLAALATLIELKIQVSFMK